MLLCLASCKREPAPPKLPCTPSIHAISRRGPPQFEGYRFLGGSADGKKVAFSVSDIGPGSGDTVGGARVFEAGATKPVWKKSYFAVHGTDAELSKVEEGMLTDFASELSAAGVEVGKQLPVQQAWCAGPDGVIYTAGGVALTLKPRHSPCAADPQHQTLSWQLCTLDGTRCAGSETDGCLDGEASLADLVRVGSVDWAVVDVKTFPFSGVEFHLYETAGGAFQK
ncbi:MAG: hypothetical protein QM723_27390 [Myxococcaceae bacterium]